MPEFELRVPDMSSGRCVRAVSAAVGDVPGVTTVQVDRDARTVRVSGTAAPAAVRAAVAAAGYHPAS
jgi:copper chaperone